MASAANPAPLLGRWRCLPTNGSPARSCRVSFNIICLTYAESLNKPSPSTSLNRIEAPVYSTFAGSSICIPNQSAEPQKWVVEMINWHGSECQRPDVVFFSGLGAPTCLSCGNIGIVDDDDNGHSSGSLPEPSSEDGFKLHWPSSLPFVDVTPTEHHSKGASNKSPQSTRKMPQEMPSPTTNRTLKRKRSVDKEAGPVYEPLDARKIRLLHLLPGTYKDPIRCKLKIANLALKPEYEALSYTWADENGDSSRSQRIYIGGRHEIMLVTANCANALRRLRFTGLTRVLWVDAICIDQDNTGERSHQVGLMQYIYATATRVLIYLGEDPTETDSAISRPWMFDNDGNTLDLRIDLSNRPYFTRVWVIQEIASARSAWVLYGSKGAKWQDILTCPEDGAEKPLTKLIKTNRERLSQSHRWLDLVARPRHRDLLELFDLINATRMCKATDLRDKVFALLGLFIGTHDAGLVPDYSLNLREVLSGMTAFFLLRQPNFWEICFAALDSRTSHNKPSWAVDWLAVESWCPTAKTPFAKWIQIESKKKSEEKPNPRFGRDGALILNGVVLCGLGDCILDSWAESGPPGTVSGLHYAPKLPLGQRIGSVKDVTWAETTDKILFVENLPDHVLVLRPLEGTGRYSFVAICRRPELDYRVAHLINVMDREVLLTLSAWNSMIGSRLGGVEGQEKWSLPETWTDVKWACQLIKHYWSLKDHSQAQHPQGEPSTYVHESPDHVHDRPTTQESPAHPSGSVRAARYPVIDLSRALFLRLQRWRQRRLLAGLPTQTEERPYIVQVYWDYGATGSFNAPGASVQTGSELVPADREWYWHPGYMRRIRACRLGKILSNLTWTSKTHLVDSTEALHCLVSTTLERLSECLDVILTHHNVDQLNFDREVGPDVDDGDSGSEAEIDAMFRWLRDSMNFCPDRDWSPKKGDSQGTWGHQFIRVWSCLMPKPLTYSSVSRRQPPRYTGKIALLKATDDTLNATDDLKKRLIHAQKPRDIFDVLHQCTFAASGLLISSWDYETPISGIVELRSLYHRREAIFSEVQSLLEEGRMEDSLDKTRAFIERLEEVLLSIKQHFEKVESDAWKLLLELVERTEKHLLPLEEAFTAEDFKTGASKVLRIPKESKWEDVYIV